MQTRRSVWLHQNGIWGEAGDKTRGMRQIMWAYRPLKARQLLPGVKRWTSTDIWTEKWYNMTYFSKIHSCVEQRQLNSSLVAVNKQTSDSQNVWFLDHQHLWECVRNASSQTATQASCIRFWGGGQKSEFYKPARWFWRKQFEKHWSRWRLCKFYLHWLKQT